VSFSNSNVKENAFLHFFFLLYLPFNPLINFYIFRHISLSNKFNVLSFSDNKQLLIEKVCILVALNGGRHFSFSNSIIRFIKKDKSN